MKSIVVAISTSLLALSAFASGAGNYQHHEGKPAETLEQAVTNFSEYNHKLEAILNGAVSDNDMHDVHELTYTLENALEKINEELAELAETLEELHQASERMDREAVLEHGRKYLSVSREVVK